LKAFLKSEYAKEVSATALKKRIKENTNMKSRIAVSVLFVLIAATAFAQSDMQTSSVAPVTSDAQKSFTTLKSLAGEWEGPVTVPEMPEMSGGKPMHLSMRVTSRGNVLVHEMQEAGTPLDAAKYDHPVTMLYVDGDQLTLIHYCDAGNRPRMTGKMSPDGKTVEFELKDISGSTEYHMHHSLFTIIDANHHTEDWTFMMGDKPMHAHFDLQRKN
jgi:hypothetical protein